MTDNPNKTRVLPSARRLMGFDSASQTFEIEHRIFRVIRADHENIFRNVLRLCDEKKLFRDGVVATWEQKSPPFEISNNSFVLEHQRIAPVTYPHEWPATMLKDAAIFHVDLFERLLPWKYTLKDWHPYNILFHNTEPVFVDFTSIIPEDELRTEKYLTPPHTPSRFAHLWSMQSKYIYEMYERMFAPYLLNPLSLMRQGKHAVARQRMRETILNVHNTTIQRSETFPHWHARSLNFVAEERLRCTLVAASTAENFYRKLRRLLTQMDVAPLSSSYAGYYESKGEQFSFTRTEDWTPKQKIVDDCLDQESPKTVLDLAGNTGWFAMLAAKRGARVIACDIDESCADLLYQRAKYERLPIVSLVMDLCNPTREYWAPDSTEESCHNGSNGHGAIIRSAQDRLASDLVLALAIIHHLTLGQGKSLADVAKLLSGFTHRCLVVEFVSIDDPLIVESPEFFPAYQSNPGNFTDYHLSTFQSELSQYFPSITITPSHPGSRMILICRRPTQYSPAEFGDKAK